MRTDRTGTTVLRIVFALIFGVMSVVHVPAMAFARTAAAHSAHADNAAAATGSGHRHHGTAAHHHGDAQQAAVPGDRTAPKNHHDPAVCDSTACCAAVALTPAAAPLSALLLLEQLRAPLGRVMIPVAPEPLVPPPRLQA